MEFEWDTAKATSNLQKHGVPFPYAARVFEDEGRLEFQDDRQDYGEPRYIVLGKVESRVLVVVCTWRSSELCRLISARKANRREAKLYQTVQT